VDVGAFGKLSSESESKVYLFSVKSGDLDRRDWDGKPQDLRPSIRIVYCQYQVLKKLLSPFVTVSRVIKHPVLLALSKMLSIVLSLIS
jgi:hypothetical protein